MLRILIKWVCGFLFACCSTGALNAQDATGKITGTVTDPSGSAVPGARVVVTNLGTQAAQVTATDANGVYQVLQLPIGMYSVSAEAAGFAKIVSKTTNPLEINQRLRLDLQLQVGSISDTVTVESQASTVETQNSTVGQTVTGRAIFELPLNGRNALDLLATQPGVTLTNPDSTAAGQYSIGGGRTDSVTYLLDGGNNNNLLSNAVVVNPNPDAIAEFRILQSNYGAEYGRNAGGIVSIVTKSGTNALHGTAYDYARNDYFNANDFFNNERGSPRNVLKRHQFGATLGGPIIVPKFYDGRNKLFFFFSYQEQRQSSIAQQGNITTFTPLQAQGNFSQTYPAGANPVATFLQAHPYYQSNPVLAAQGVIDPARIDPVARRYLSNNLIPIAPSGLLFAQAGAQDNDDEYLGKIDYNITSKDVLSATLSSRANTRLEPFAGSGYVTGYPDNRLTDSYFGTVTYTHTFTPALLNEFRATAQRNNAKTFQPVGRRPTPAELGIGITPDQPTGPTILGFSGRNTSVGFSPNGPTNLIDNTYAFYDNLAWTRGSHNTKFGFYYSPYQNNTVYDYYINGEYFFYGPSTGVGSGDDFADFLLGLPDEYLQFPKAPSNIRSNSYAGYAQDEWHVSRRLTLSYGIRYEYAEPKYDTQGRSFSFIPGLQSTRFVNAPRNLVFPGDKGVPRGANFSDKNDWAPRFGFAWDVLGNAKTSVRGGLGMFYDILKAEDNLQFNGQAPFFGFADVFFDPPSTSATAGPNYLSQPFVTNNSGTPNPFPSRPPASNLNFDAAGFLPIGGGGVYYVDPNLRTPYVFHYNLSVQQQVAPGTVVETGYVGYSAHKLTSLVDVNPFVLGTNRRVYNSSSSNSTFSYLDEFQNVVKANYNALEVSLTKRITDNRLFGSTFFTFAYTWAHEIDNASGFRQRNGLVPFYDHNYFRASGDTDIRNTISFSGGWELPFDRLWTSGPKLLTRGWSVYPIVTWRTGFPLDVLAGLSTSRRDPGPAGDGQASLVRADLNGTIRTLDARQSRTFNGVSGNYYFDPSLFSATRLNALDQVSRTNAGAITNQLTFGSLPRNALRGPSFVNADLSIAKHFYLLREGKLDAELRGDAFNVLNHANFANPNVSINDPTNFGRISSVVGASSATNPTGPRIIQVALHLRF